VSLQPPIDNKGKLPGIETFDDPQLEIVKEEVAKCNNTTGGPEKFSDNSRHPGE